MLPISLKFKMYKYDSIKDFLYYKKSQLVIFLLTGCKYDWDCPLAYPKCNPNGQCERKWKCRSSFNCYVDSKICNLSHVRHFWCKWFNFWLLGRWILMVYIRLMIRRIFTLSPIKISAAIKLFRNCFEFSVENVWLGRSYQKYQCTIIVCKRVLSMMHSMHGSIWQVSRNGSNHFGTKTLVWC